MKSIDHGKSQNHAGLWKAPLTFMRAACFAAMLSLGTRETTRAQGDDVILQVDGYYMKAAMETLRYETETELDAAALNYFKSNEFKEEFKTRSLAGETVIAGVPVAAQYSDASWTQFQRDIEALAKTKFTSKQRSFFLESKGLKVIADTWLKAIDLATKSKLPPLKIEVLQDSSEAQDITVTVSGPPSGLYGRLSSVTPIGCWQQRTFLESIGIISTIRPGAEIPSGGLTGKFRKEKGHPMPHIVIASTMGYGVAVLKPFPKSPIPPPPPPPPLRELVFPAGHIEANAPQLSPALQTQGFGETDQRDLKTKYDSKWSVEVDADWKVRVKYRVEVWSPISKDVWGTPKIATFEPKSVELDFGKYRTVDPRLNEYMLILDPEEPAESATVTGDTRPGVTISHIRFNGPSGTIITGASANTGGGKCEGAFWRIDWREFKLRVVKR